MPHKDPEARRAYMREWQKRNYHANLEASRARGRADAKRFNQRHPERVKTIQKTSRDRYTKLKSTSKRRKIELSLTYDEYKELISTGTCHYCYKSLNETGSGLDRKNNEPCYSLQTAVPCCRRCNLVFGPFFSYDEKLIIAAAIRECDSRRPTIPAVIGETKRSLRVKDSPQGELFPPNHPPLIQE